jgi:hypothetical protein
MSPSAGGLGSLEGLAAFRDQFGPRVKTVLVGTGGIPLADYLASSPQDKA